MPSHLTRRMSFVLTAWIVALSSLCMSLTTLASTSLIKEAAQKSFLTNGDHEVRLVVQPTTKTQHQSKERNQVQS